VTATVAAALLPATPWQVRKNDVFFRRAPVL